MQCQVIVKDIENFAEIKVSDKELPQKLLKLCLLFCFLVAIYYCRKLNNLCAKHFADKTLLLLEPLETLASWTKEYFEKIPSW